MFCLYQNARLKPYSSLLLRLSVGLVFERESWRERDREREKEKEREVERERGRDRDKERQGMSYRKR